MFLEQCFTYRPYTRLCFSNGQFSVQSFQRLKMDHKCYYKVNSTCDIVLLFGDELLYLVPCLITWRSAISKISVAVLYHNDLQVLMCKVTHEMKMLLIKPSCTTYTSTKDTLWTAILFLQGLTSCMMP